MLPALLAGPAGPPPDAGIKVLPVFVLAYLLNLGQAIAFRRSGFLASFTLRLGEYMMWHVVYGNFIYPTVFH